MRMLIALALAVASLAALPACAQPDSEETAVGSGRAEAVILMYHKFGEAAYPATNIGLSQFESHLDILARGDYRVLPLPEIVAALAAGEALPERTVAITIDDAYLSAFEHAWPRLRARGFPVTLFVATQPLDRGYEAMMSWDQLRGMAAHELVTIGHHTATHAHLPRLSAPALAEEIEGASARFADELGAVPALFSYPYGEFGLRERGAVIARDFAAAVGQHSGAAGAGSDLFALPRFPINERYGDLDRFRRVIDTRPLPIFDLMPRDWHIVPGDPNPPPLAFTLGAAAGPPGNLACYGPGGEGLALEIGADRRVSVALNRPLETGRQRINCTKPAGAGRWYWTGIQFTVTEE